MHDERTLANCEERAVSTCSIKHPDLEAYYYMDMDHHGYHQSDMDTTK